MPEPAFQYATLSQQHGAARLGMWTFLATEVLFFGGVLLAYVVYRYGYPAAFAEAARHTHIAIGAANTAILLTSSFLVAWGVEAAKHGFGRFAALLLWSAAASGLVFMALKGYEYRLELSESLFPDDGFAITGSIAGGARLFFVFYFIATALHALHVAIGIAVLAAIGARARGGAYSPAYHAPLTVAGLYWHFVDMVWIFLFALIYLPGRA
ncbi:MAG: cytochrome c oxidase subunit 3 [Variibacter sp.]